MILHDSNSPSKPTQPMANTTGQDTATAKSPSRHRKPLNSATFAQSADENSPKALSNGSRNCRPTHSDYKREGAPGLCGCFLFLKSSRRCLGTDSPAIQAVWKLYNSLIEKFGNEYSVLMDALNGCDASVVDAPIAQAVMKVRDGTAKVTPGYDGVYGQFVLGIEPKVKA